MRSITAVYDTSAPKRSVNLSLNADLVARARRLTDNLSAEVESLLAAFVESQEGQTRAEVETLKRAAEDWNDFADRHGSFADEFSTL
jgi:antitoxin CcdA